MPVNGGQVSEGLSGFKAEGGSALAFVVPPCLLSEYRPERRLGRLAPLLRALGSAQPGPYGHHRIRALAKNGSHAEAPLSVKTFRFSEQT